MRETRPAAPKQPSYKSAAEFTEVLRQTLEQARTEKPNDPELKTLQDEMNGFEAEGKFAESQAALRKWFMKRRV
ncbi:hypothetical protein CCAX7_57300 [Capsulimonas corticalis]|uniref:Uncharacterized protein n=1 Tax=Capsulimonas corticalis TaxID=2219043 RepID=A0A402D0E8_9BACT|nr:hypothetical protein [Capsulimonas corticalis]BDI33679.1 hypothetical protein CCAX7_57300 [Capsulimonas corticalis]